MARQFETGTVALDGGHTERHGCEPSLLKTGQAYYALIEPFCHTDYDTGADIRYQAALVVVGGFDGWFFE